MTQDLYSKNISFDEVCNTLTADLGINRKVLEVYVNEIEKTHKKYNVYEKAKLLADKCAYNLEHEDWPLVAGRFDMYSLKDKIPKTFSEYIIVAKSLFKKDIYEFLLKVCKTIDKKIDDSRDYRFDYFAINTLKKTFLWKKKYNGEHVIIETPQYMYIRIGVQLYYNTENAIDKIISTYNDLSKFNPYYTHASPTVFNSCGINNQLSSCYLITMQDSIDSISKTWHDMANISKRGGGMGIDASDIRHSEIAETGESGGITPLLKVLNNILNYIDQAGKRKGSATIYLPCWHKDIFAFLELRKNTGSDYLRARDLFYCLWVSDLFFKRLYEDGMWSLFCPNIAKGLNDIYGLEFESKYISYENEGIYSHQVKARDLLKAIYNTWFETGMPFMCSKDNVNRKSNQKNLGTIRCSNLCTEIVEYTSKDEIASCNLASICLDSCVVELKRHIYKTEYMFKNTKIFRYNDNKPVYFDFDILEKNVRKVVRNLNQAIDTTYYPDNVPQIKFSNMKNRPIGIGVQGLADTFAKLDMVFASEKAQKLNILIFETIYYAFVSESMIISKNKYFEHVNKLRPLEKLLKDAEKNNEGGKVMTLERKINKMIQEWGGSHYKSFEGSPLSKGEFHFDMWKTEQYEKRLFMRGDDIKDIKDVTNNVNRDMKKYISDRYDWEKLRKDVKMYGVQNSLGIALMPTATSAQINRRNESFEPFQELISTRSVLSGQFLICNRYAMEDLRKIGLWNTETIQNIISNSGSLQYLSSSNQRLQYLKQKYLTSYEISHKLLVKMHCDRCIFVDQTASFNVHMTNPSYEQMTSLMFDQWFGGAKTIWYYLRTKPSYMAKNIVTNNNKSEKKYDCTEDVCTACVL